MSNILSQISQSVIEGNLEVMAKHAQDALDEGLSAEEILNNGLMIGMQRIGVRFRDRKVFVPDVLIAAKAMSAAMVHIRPCFFSVGQSFASTRSMPLSPSLTQISHI